LFVDEAGKDSPARRDRLRMVVGFVEEFYRGLVWAATGCAVRGDELLLGAIHERLARACVDPTHCVAVSLDSCLDALEYVDRNANLALVIQKLCDDLALPID
jgi:hypothetical protein